MSQQKNTGWAEVRTDTQQEITQQTQNDRVGENKLAYATLTQPTTDVLPSSWRKIPTADTFKQISTNNKKVKTKDCQAFGKYPVIDQGQEEIAGFIDDENRIIKVSNPLVIFGDHTRIIKWVNHNFVPGADGTKILEAATFVYPRYFYYQLKSIELPDKGYSRHFKYLNESTFKVAPIAEQQKIAAKLDELLAQVNSIKTRLDAIPKILKRFRQSVLAAAVSGKLTEDWRKTVTLINWEKVNIGQIASVATGKTPSRAELAYWNSGTIPWLTSSATGSKFCFDAEQYVSEIAVKKCTLKLFSPGTLLLAMYGEGKTRGQVTELKISATCNQACAAIMVDEKVALTEFVKLRLFENYEETRKAASGGNQPNLNLNKVRDIPIFLPPIDEQTEIARRVEQLFAYADQIEQRVKDAQARVNHLTQAILAKAFRGELTADWRAQNPDLISGENSAEALLAKIQTERSNVNTGKSSQRRRSV
ncbi:restriction endonuclease subunit S [Methylicorpusculum sp.]|uniref:restriction endonuclease subunit S n=1 Tax=Methylicorpusculum sp. TaxID=2713644 RepID=UPI00271EBA9C|nr:restriction endonuclease subunit S [Methylicorpusculum sp.]MDO8844770.1 restriction endonuclease subunit S [Methylicorpusculum sp.]